MPGSRSASVVFSNDEESSPVGSPENLSYYPSNYSNQQMGANPMLPGNAYGSQGDHSMMNDVHGSNKNMYNNGYSMPNPVGAEATHHPIGGRMFAMSSPFGDGGFADEPPLLEELGINFSHMRNKSIAVLNPFSRVDKEVLEDSDLAGPLVFCLLYGAFLLLTGKIHFSYIYGVGLVGCFSIYLILNLMSEKGIDGSQTASVLGYCLLPLVLLSGLSILLALKGPIGYTLAVASILWCTYSSSTIFATILAMKEQRILVSYPIGLLYAFFALMTVF